MRLTPIEGENREKVTKKSSHEATSRCYSKYFSPGRIKLPSILNVEEEAADLLDLDGVRELQATGSRHRVPKKYNTPEVSGPSKPPGKKKKTSRPYAPPETYAHLAHIPDYLKDNLDGKQGSGSWIQTLTRTFYSCILWNKVSHTRMHRQLHTHRDQPSGEVIHRWTPLCPSDKSFLEVFDPVEIYRPYNPVRRFHASREI